VTVARLIEILRRFCFSCATQCHPSDSKQIQGRLFESNAFRRFFAIHSCSAILSAQTSDSRHASLKEITGPVFLAAISLKSDLNKMTKGYVLRHYFIIDEK
jgi:hypothetical protein